MKKALLLAFLGSIGNLLYSQMADLTLQLDSVTHLIDSIVNIEPGTTIIITDEEKNFYTSSNGLASIEFEVPNTTTTSYDLASIGKMFTGYCIATLQANGEISMDDEIQKYLKDFPEYDYPITVGHLVHHTSGIKNWTYLIDQMGWSNEDKITTDQLVRAIYAQKTLEFEPGEKYSYSNS
ncbi:MAG: serine hydrolase domain-containing protein, partial [Bacteroidota bacterium]